MDTSNIIKQILNQLKIASNDDIDTNISLLKITKEFLDKEIINLEKQKQQEFNLIQNEFMRKGGWF